MINNNPQFHTFAEILNELRISLNKLDRDLIKSYTTRIEFLRDQWQWVTHIRNHYYLDHPDNPLTWAAVPRISAEEMAGQIACSIWDELRFPFFAPTDYA